jgi:EAL domain-containing protein (putative c-di-GMP-specific phosphodiesterase class I)
LGVTLALDDFGTGYSSLAYLSQLPFDKLKIDRSFVSSSDESPRRKEVLRSIIVMAHSLGMEVVCEGAETEGEIRLLRALDADQVQGYAIARPAAAEAALEMVRHIEARTAPQPQQAIA